MADDHAVPPTARERERLRARVRTIIPVALFAGVAALWLLLEFGGDWVQEGLGIAMLVVFAIWILGWPVRKWREMRRRR